LPAAVAVPDCDGQCDLRDRDTGTADRDPALDQGPDHGEETARRTFNRRGVITGRGHGAVAVEEVESWDPDLIEIQPAVVDAVQTEFVTTVLEGTTKA